MEHNYCLNCAAETGKNFCPNCGQKTDTHRIKMKHFIVHDLLHGVWHFEKGILFTIKEIFKRPGQAALDYIGGKRIRYYNVFYLSLLLIGLNILLVHLYREINPADSRKTKDTLKVIAFLSQYINFIVFAVVPLLALNAWMIFKRLRLNIAEHFILGGINLAGILMLYIFYKFFDFVNNYFAVPKYLSLTEVICFVLFMFFPAWTYYNAARKLYSLPGFGWRILIFYILTILQIFIFLSVIITTLSDNPKLQINL